MEIERIMHWGRVRKTCGMALKRICSFDMSLEDAQDQNKCMNIQKGTG